MCEKVRAGNKNLGVFTSVEAIKMVKKIQREGQGINLGKRS